MFRIGIVGAGIMAAYHKKAMLKNGECVLAAVCDIAAEKAEAIAESVSATVYTDYRKMPEAELDGVILNLPHYLHREVTEFFLEKGIPVLVEKPMAISCKECDSMIEASKRYGTPLAVGHVQKYHPCYRELREIFREKRLGELCCITETRNVDYFTDRPKWFLNKKQAGGGIVMNYCAHTLDKIFYVTDLQVEQVMAHGNNFLNEDDVEASAQVLLKMTNGVSAAFTYCATKVPEKYDIYFYFTKGMVWIQDGWCLWVTDESQQLYKPEIDYSCNIFTAQINEFVKWLKGEPNELVTPEYAREIVSVLEKIYDAIDG